MCETSCSGSWQGNATQDGHVYQLRILDYGANFNLHAPLITVYQRQPETRTRTPRSADWFVGSLRVNAKVSRSVDGLGNPGETLAVRMPLC